MALSGAACKTNAKRRMAWRNTSRYTARIANGLRNAYQRSGFVGTDLALMKNTKTPHGERGSLGCSVQMFSALNHPNFIRPRAELRAGNFGTVQMVPPVTAFSRASWVATRHLA
jgi:hypothetical protein